MLQKVEFCAPVLVDALRCAFGLLLRLMCDLDVGRLRVVEVRRDVTTDEEVNLEPNANARCRKRAWVLFTTGVQQ